MVNKQYEICFFIIIPLHFLAGVWRWGLRIYKYGSSAGTYVKNLFFTKSEAHENWSITCISCTWKVKIFCICHSTVHNALLYYWKYQIALNQNSGLTFSPSLFIIPLFCLSFLSICRWIMCGLCLCISACLEQWGVKIKNWKFYKIVK